MGKGGRGVADRRAHGADLVDGLHGRCHRARLRASGRHVQHVGAVRRGDDRDPRPAPIWAAAQPSGTSMGVDDVERPALAHPAQGAAIAHSVASALRWPRRAPGRESIRG